MSKTVYRLLIVILSVMALGLSGCKKVKEITVTSVQVESISPQGLRGVNVYLAVGIDNPAFYIGMEDVHGALKHSGKVLGRIALDPFVLQAKSAEIYHLKAFVSLGEDAKLRDLLMLTNMEKLNECVIDVYATPKLKSGLGAPITVKNIPLKELLESTIENEKN
ncbi:MAG: hypothetical protein J6V17_03430 [Bacteroidales bacterium]|nr:hypothetical protein [Bacteroidales bacterium]